MPKTVYLCEHCGQLYDTRVEARICEVKHEYSNVELNSYERIKDTIIKEGSLPCKYCNRTYLVYGSEINCDCCNKCIGFNLFVPQKDVAREG